MIDTKLILLEGLPGTGKSTNSSFLLAQLLRNGIEVKYIHEVAAPHPTIVIGEGGYLWDYTYRRVHRPHHCEVGTFHGRNFAGR